MKTEQERSKLHGKKFNVLYSACGVTNSKRKQWTRHIACISERSTKLR